MAAHAPHSSNYNFQSSFLSEKADSSYNTTTASDTMLSSRRQSMRSPQRKPVQPTVTQAAELYVEPLPPVAEFSKKIVVVGDGGCGKTCLLISYSQGYFPEKYVPTVFENYITHTKHQPTGKVVELALWDTAGQEEYDRLRPLSYPETDVLFVCFAIDCPNSLENVMDKWYPEVLHFCPNTPLILVGLKSDLRTKRTCIDLLKTQGLAPITTEQGQAVANRMSAEYVECSSKEMSGVQEIFEHAVDVAVGIEIDASAGKAGRGSRNGGRSGAAAGGGGGGEGKGRRLKKGTCKIL